MHFKHSLALLGILFANAALAQSAPPTPATGSANIPLTGAALSDYFVGNGGLAVNGTGGNVVFLPPASLPAGMSNGPGYVQLSPSNTAVLSLPGTTSGYGSIGFTGPSVTQVNAGGVFLGATPVELLPLSGGNAAVRPTQTTVVTPSGVYAPIPQLQINAGSQFVHTQPNGKVTVTPDAVTTINLPANSTYFTSTPPGDVSAGPSGVGFNGTVIPLPVPSL